MTGCIALAGTRDLRRSILFGRGRFAVSLSAGAALGIVCGLITVATAAGSSGLHARPSLIAPLIVESLPFWLLLIVTFRLTFSAGVQTLAGNLGGRFAGIAAAALLEAALMMPALTMRVDTPSYPPETTEEAYAHGVIVLGQAIIGPIFYAIVRASSGSLLATACAQFTLYLTFILFL